MFSPEVVAEMALLSESAMPDTVTFQQSTNVTRPGGVVEKTYADIPDSAVKCRIKPIGGAREGLIAASVQAVNEFIVACPRSVNVELAWRARVVTAAGETVVLDIERILKPRSNRIDTRFVGRTLKAGG